MTIKDELREQFSFLKRQPYENKKEYKRRIKTRGQELFDRKNCTIDESISFRALSNCRAKVYIMNIDGEQMVFGDLDSKEYALRKGNAKDYEKFVDLLFFEHIDEKEYKREKGKLYDEYVDECNSRSYSDPYYYDYDYDKLLNDEQLERTYEKEVKGKVRKKNKIIY